MNLEEDLQELSKRILVKLEPTPPLWFYYVPKHPQDFVKITNSDLSP